jgi:hypothetical protein
VCGFPYLLHVYGFSLAKNEVIKWYNEDVVEYDQPRKARVPGFERI